ncbi:hypothetical protein D1J60_10770 [Streptomyces sp. W1SF4]|nr:hypothetical protein D1J60_10770 [Streptomyces sp. W1SF4]RSS37375.1 hypothetical protein EF912_34845 [Streptomyces sp. WAC07061]
MNGRSWRRPRTVGPADARIDRRVRPLILRGVMRIRSAVTASVLAAGILLGGAGAALANDGVEIDYFDAGHKTYSSDCSTFAAVPHNLPAFAGPVYQSSCHKDGEKDWANGSHLGA